MLQVNVVSDLRLFFRVLCPFGHLVMHVSFSEFCPLAR
jgi:hypothetical protein